MSSIACFGSLVSSFSREGGRLVLSGRPWPQLVRTRFQQRFSRSVQTAAPVEDVVVLKEKEIEEEDALAKKQRIERVRDISGLNRFHRRTVNGLLPSDEPRIPWHYKVVYHKRMLGRYGYVSGVNPRVCWPTQKELENKIEYESIAYPYEILEVAERERAKRAQEEQERLERDEQIAKNVKKMLILKEDLLKRRSKAKEDAKAAQAFKMRLIEEVRLHFNHTISERDERFKLELKDRAHRLREKEKLEKKTIKKEKLAVSQAAKFEEEKKKLLEKEKRSQVSDVQPE